MDDPISYSKATPEQRKLLDRVGDCLVEAGYRPGQGWIIGERVEIYSHEAQTTGLLLGKPEARIILDLVKKKGYLIRPDAIEGVVMVDGPTGPVVKIGWAKEERKKRARGNKGEISKNDEIER